jgi:hypothetical protein
MRSTAVVPDVIEVRRDGALVATISVNRDVIKVGRLAGSHVRLDDDRVSRMHAVLERDGDGWTLIDLGSSEGTHVDGKRVSKARLSPTSVVGIGPFSITFGAAAAQAPSPPTPPAPAPAATPSARATPDWRCPACGHGRRAATGHVRTQFVPDDGLETDRPAALSMLRADVCAACGHLALFADPQAFLGGAT